MSGPRALWVPFEIDNFAQTRSFYVDRLGMSVVDEWSVDGEHGVVLRAAENAYVELVAPGLRRQAPVAFELGSQAEVDAAFAHVGDVEVVRPPGRYPRGHYGFEVRDPAGAHLMLWHEHG
ncbi:VOC family protein [Actinokineospora iranica]|uniref:Glyoxalase/Bleomycin resistance protein/Dioxygenase superfamily protein n=1 Tax=Actinokineospora iranica TaxID=1271860 RepID=A0A1G6N2N6_9PSEU|nr:VOC family protein [Actinokineospora iranica]SDC62080.1 Glyoxalase/Bleomycin resistance protein/Dioxygenase superfamily protein [Actinokineospora iranica]